MNEKLNKKAIEKAGPKPSVSEPKVKELTPVRKDELAHIEGGACALLRIPPYWRCW